MSATTTAVRGRRAAEREMTSTCTIRAVSTEPVTDPTTGEVTYPASAVVYSGKCRVRPGSTWGRSMEAGGTELSASVLIVSVPFAATGIRQGQPVEVTASPDPELVGRVLEIRFIPDVGDHITARRLICEEQV